MTPTSYDDHQRAAQRRTCSVCGLSFDVTHAANADGWRCSCSAEATTQSIAAMPIESLEYQAMAKATHRPCGEARCVDDFPGMPSRWCSGCLIAALLERLKP